MDPLNTCLVIIWAVLFELGNQATANPGTPELRQGFGNNSLKFSWKTVSRIDEYEVWGTTYHSLSRGWYRFDAFADNQLFVFPRENLAVYYFPFYDNEKNSQNRTCWKMELQPAQGHLPSPIPSRDNYNLQGHGYYQGKEVPKYVAHSNPPEFHGTQYTIELELLFEDLHSQYPLQSGFKIWYSDSRGAKDRIYTHEVTEYYSFSNYVADDVWVSPITGSSPAMEDYCLTLNDTDSRRDTIRNFAQVVHLPEELLEYSFETTSMGTNRFHRTGGIAFNISMASTYYDDDNDDYGSSTENEDLPANFDWRDSGIVTPVKNQRYCGSCWAFAAAAALESAYARKYQQTVVLSEQYLIDCDWAAQNNGCSGGSARDAYQWIKNSEYGGIPLSDAYGPYRNMNGRCSIHPKTKLYAKIDRVVHIPPHDPNALKSHLIKYGPVVVAVMGEPMFSYTSGILHYAACEPENINHNVLIVGYGETDKKEPYWIVKNSWGYSWGMDGYFLVSAKPDENTICILHSPLVPVLQ